MNGISPFSKGGIGLILAGLQQNLPIVFYQTNFHAVDGVTKVKGTFLMPDRYDEVGDTVLRPHYFAHVVLRTAKYLPMRNFYKTFLGGHATYENEKLCFITYDEEHHRVAIINLADTGPKIASSAGLEHIAYAFKSLEDLAVAYRQRKARGIVPVWSVNHGPTTSMYYKDPDGNKIEVQVDNFDTVQETTEFFHTKEFAENPIGVDFDPEDLIRRLRSGEDPKAIMKRPNIGPRTSFNRP